jgi:membrane-associated protease RseP (regulator of RpoE activity)
MAILLAHELGHYFAGRHHGVDVSPPYFIPVPIPPLGTMGAVIRMRGAIRTRNALLDVGAAGPLAGMAVALPVLVYGIATSSVEPLPESGYLLEGRSALYLALLFVIKGMIPAGHDIFLTNTAFAGWAGLLVTMINLLPIGQLDGGHIAYALLGPRQNVFSERFRRALPLFAVFGGIVYGVEALQSDVKMPELAARFAAGYHWLVWTFVLWLMTRMTGPDHPPTGPEPLSPARRVVAASCLALFAMLFMPAWIQSR